MFVLMLRCFKNIQVGTLYQLSINLSLLTAVSCPSVIKIQNQQNNIQDLDSMSISHILISFFFYITFAVSLRTLF